MKSSQIQKALQFHPQTKSTFGGVFARNKVPTIPKRKYISYVVNTDPSHKPGEHWVAFFFTPSEVYYFDPYGIPPARFERILNSRRKKTLFWTTTTRTGSNMWTLLFVLYSLYANALCI